MIPYKEITKYYDQIITNIYNEIEEVTPIEKGEGLCDIKYPPEYKNAYGWLQKAEWRLSEVYSMEKYYNEPGFEHYGLENLHDVKNRIENYLNDTTWEYTNKVTDYHKYDTIVDQRMTLIQKPKAHEYWKYYYELHHQDNYKTNIEWEIKSILESCDNFKWTLTQNLGENYLTNTETILHELEKIEEQVKKLEPKYKTIPKP